MGHIRRDISPQHLLTEGFSFLHVFPCVSSLHTRLGYKPLTLVADSFRYPSLTSHSPECRNIFSIASFVWMKLTTYIVPAHFGQINGSTSYTFLINAAHRQRACLAVGPGAPSAVDGSKPPGLALIPRLLIE